MKRCMQFQVAASALPPFLHTKPRVFLSSANPMPLRPGNTIIHLLRYHFNFIKTGFVSHQISLDDFETGERFIPRGKKTPSI